MSGNLVAAMTLANHPLMRAFALGCAAVALFTLMWQSDEPKEPVEAAALRGQSEPDGFVVKGRFMSFDETGRLTVRFESPRIEQFEDRNLATMESPRALVFGEGEPDPWRITADSGTVRDSTEVVELEGNVKVVRRTENNRQATLTTSRLTLNNVDRTAYTDAPVELTDSFSVTRAIGMKAWMDDRILELDSQVEGRYEPGQQANP
ncbi:LPS export ABC transporter periplasmic protein LptC [Marinobacter lipolyticus]|uniref:LPS export ABC transporter periplasmic protein LptC n=1 Tax=Marinobacter lipolyticus TaxID=209639 RepID=UPI001D18C249|nr:LPS export ABC transporter periplasmic protein LptC [Marinobacter lipolyticus]